jgi:hypothetical protein
VISVYCLISLAFLLPDKLENVRLY